MKCANCGAELPLEAGQPIVRCHYCGASAPRDTGWETTKASLLADRDHDGVPDILQQGGAAPFRAPARPLLEGIPPAPRAPSSRARSLVFAYRGSQGVLLFMGVVFFLIGSVSFVAFGGLGLPGDLLLAVTGTSTHGTVVRVSTMSNVKINGVRPRLIRYRYEMGGETIEDESSTTDVGAASKLGPGSRVEVEVSSVLPGLSRVAGTTRTTMGYFIVFLMIFPSIGAVLAARSIASNRREIRAFVHGTPIEARVTHDGFDQTVKVNGRHPYKLGWEFDVAGRTYRGSITNMDRDPLKDLVDGERVAVLYHPSDPAVNTVWVA